MYYTHVPKHPICPEVPSKARNDTEDAHTQVSHCQVSEEEVGLCAHLTVLEDHHNHQQVTCRCKRNVNSILHTQMERANERKQPLCFIVMKRIHITCHLSNKTSLKPVHFSTSQLWLTEVSK